MSAITLPFVTTVNATTANPVNIERTVEFYAEDVPNPGQGTNPPDPARYSGYPRYSIVFKVAIDQRTGVTSEVRWVYPDEEVRDTDLALLVTATTKTL
jgi:hypothetical protein